MKFRYYLVDDEFEVTGTDNEKVARLAAEGDNGIAAVIDSETGVDLVHCDIADDGSTVLLSLADIKENAIFIPS